MERTVEDSVTKILSVSEILVRNDISAFNENKKNYNLNSEYNLSLFLKKENSKPKYMDKYLFVK